MQTGIALAGGGSRGSYELGAWRALRELGQQFDVVAGTSIGSINGALMVQDDFELTARLWDEIRVDDVMADGLNLDLNIEAILRQKDAIMPFLKKYMSYRGADITPLRKLLGEVLNEDRFFASPIRYGAVTVRFPSLAPVEITKETIEPGTLRDWVLCSAACFPAFPMQTIGSQSYIDGGYSDNLPISLAFELGAEEVVAVDLDPNPVHSLWRGRPDVHYIVPSRPLGSILLFEPEVLRRNAQLGYSDTMRFYGRLRGRLYAFDGVDEQKYTALGRALLRSLRQMERYLAQQRRFPLGQKELPLTACLALGPEGSPSYSDLFLRGCELAAELFALDPYVIYTPEALCGQLLEAERAARSREAAARLWAGLAHPQLVSAILAELLSSGGRPELQALPHSLPEAVVAALVLQLLSTPQET